MRSSLARRIFTTTLAIVILSPLISGFTIHRKNSPDQIVADQTSQESVQLQIKDISRRPNDINDGTNEFIFKAATVTTIIRDETDNLHEGSAVPEVPITDIKLPPNIEKETAENINDNKTITPKLKTPQETKENSRTVASVILQISQPVENPSIKEDDSNMTTELGTISNIDQTATDFAINAGLSTGKYSTSSESKTDITNYTHETTQDSVVGETTPELTTTEQIVFRNSKTPEIVAIKEGSQLDDTTTVDISTSNSDDGEPNITTVPSWKKYVTIDRKRTNSEEITTEIVERDQKPSEIAQSIAKAPLKLSIMLNNDYITSTDSNLQDRSTETKSTEKQRIMSSSDAVIRLTSVSTIDTKRAGFLDFSKSSSSEPSSTTDTNTEVFEQQASRSEAMTTKKPSAIESQSQLTEDAINEELLREEIIINHEENTIRHQKVQLLDSGKQVMEVAPVSKEVNVTSTEDTLSVQPISQDRKTTLYTISPNYKPMKKIDVQPPKPFVRDPDDNSWRNESISSLGIVFKPKNATKSFKEVLKNKTETEFLNIPENRDNRNELPDLRVRLEKIAEDRKSKKKKTYKSGEVIYTDYEENSSGEASSTTTTEKFDNIVFDLFNHSASFVRTETTTPMSLVKLETTTDKTPNDFFKKFDVGTVATGKPKKYFNAAEYYDTTDEYDADYVTLSKIDLKKFTQPYPQHKATAPTRPSPLLTRYTTNPMSRPQFPERKPTVQYFPPRKMQNVNIDHYDDNFQKKVNFYSSKEKINPKDFFSFTINEPVATEKPTTTPSSQFKYTAYPIEKTTKDVYLTTQSRLSSPHGFVLNDENFNRGSYVIKHYKDFLDEAAKTSEFDKIPDFIYPDRPEKVNGLTTSPPFDAGDIPPRKTTENDYDYETEFRKDVLHRFVENFNQNSERFKIDFPILYNNSIVHQKFDNNGRVASSSAFMKRLYGNEIGTKPSPFSSPRKNCEPNCDMTVELSPAYELHYFVPEQEEKALPVESPATPPPFNFKL